LAAAALIAGAILAYNAWEVHTYNQGWNAHKVVAEADKLAASNAALTKFNAAAKDAKTREDALRASLSTSDKNRFDDGVKNEKLIEYWRTRARAGDSGLRVAVDPNSLPGCAKSDGTGLAAGSAGEANALVMPRIAESVFSIAGRIAANMRRYNDLVDRYGEVVATCNSVAP
jgi:hypothetical protein